MLTVHVSHGRRRWPRKQVGRRRCVSARIFEASLNSPPQSIISFVTVCIVRPCSSMLLTHFPAHAAQIVLDAPVKKTMIPINVTHTAIVTRAIHAQLLSPASPYLPKVNASLPKAATNLRHTVSTLTGSFAASYKRKFGFNDGPPLHDALTVAYVSQPELFHASRYRVDVELTGTLVGRDRCGHLEPSGL